MLDAPVATVVRSEKARYRTPARIECVPRAPAHGALKGRRFSRIWAQALGSIAVKQFTN